MRAFARKQNRPQGSASSRLARSNMATSGPDLYEYPILRLQGMIGNQAVQRLLRQVKPDSLEDDSRRIPLHSKTMQAKLTVHTPGDIYEQEAGRVSEQVMRMPEPQLQHNRQTEPTRQGHERMQTERAGSSGMGEAAVSPVVHEVLQQSNGATAIQPAPDPDYDDEEPIVRGPGLSGLGLADNEIPFLAEMDKKRAEEKRAEKEQEEKEDNDRHDGLMILRQMLSEHGYSKNVIMDLLVAGGVRNLLIVRHYGCEPPTLFTKQATYQNCVVNALNRYDEEWRKVRGMAGQRMQAVTDKDDQAFEEQRRKEEFNAAGIEGLDYVTGSVFGAIGARVTSLVTDDPRKITAGAGIGAAASGVVGAFAGAKDQQGSYSPAVVGGPPVPASVGAWRYAKPAVVKPATPSGYVAPRPAPEPMPRPDPMAPKLAAPAKSEVQEPPSKPYVSEPKEPVITPHDAAPKLTPGEPVRRIVPPPVPKTPPTVGSTPAAEVAGQARSGPISPAEHRIRTLAGKDVIVGVQAKITVTDGPALESLGGARFSQLDKARAAAVGGTGRAAILPEVEQPNYLSANRGSQPSAGFIVEPLREARELEVLAWNTGDPVKEANTSHAERQLIEWFRGRDPKWKGRVKEVEVTVFGRDICEQCADDIRRLQKGYPHTKFTWVRGDSGQRSGR